jgi:pantoate--beta-alanine ligase
MRSVSMQVLVEIDACRDAVRGLRGAGRRVGLVPTMGALHAGHVSLVRAAREQCDAVVVTIFVNPAQFGPGEDFARYPRPIDDDVEACRVGGVDVVFSPTVEAMYPDGARTTVQVGGLTSGLCGPHRPGHFEGVATVVAKLFNIVPADAAFFGEKDYQQLVVIRQMARDLNIPVEVVGCPTVREPDGLALSSRNKYLSSSERRQALSLSEALFAARDRIGAGDHDVGVNVSRIRRQLSAAGVADVDYVEVVDAVTLEPLTAVDRPARIAAAVRIGACRLIDNVAAEGKKARRQEGT